MHRVQESIHFLQGSLCQGLDLVDPLIDHGGKFTSLICILFRAEVELIQYDFDCLEKLLMCELEILVGYRHLEV